MKEPEVVASGIGFCEGPVWTREGRLVVTSIDHGCLYEITKGQAKVLANTGGGPNGLAEGADGTLYVAQNGGIFGMGEKSPEAAEPGIQAVRGEDVTYVTRGLDAPNDLCFGPDGRLYFTDPRGPATAENMLPGRVYAVSPGASPALLIEGPAFTNGIAFGPSGDYLYVAETFRQRVLRYPFKDGSLGEPETFCTTEPGFPDGMCLDVDGRVYVAATLAHEVQVFAPDGSRLYSLPCSERSLPTNCCFGGPHRSTLYVTDSMSGRVLTFNLSTAGLPLYPFR